MRYGPKAFQARPTQRACIEHPCQQCADDAAHAMNAAYVQRIVHLQQALQAIHAPQADGAGDDAYDQRSARSEEPTSELQSLMRSSYAVFGLKQPNTPRATTPTCNTTHQPNKIHTYL